MKSSISRIGGAVLLIGVVVGSALGQNLGSATAATSQLQSFQHSAIKMAEVGAGVGIGMTVIGLALHARHHGPKRSNKEASNVDYKALSEEYARQLQELQARSLSPAAAAPVVNQARVAVPGAETAAPAGLPLQAPAANTVPPAAPDNPRQ